MSITKRYNYKPRLLFNFSLKMTQQRIQTVHNRLESDQKYNLKKHKKVERPSIQHSALTANKELRKKHFEKYHTPEEREEDYKKAADHIYHRATFWDKVRFIAWRVILWLKKV